MTKTYSETINYLFGLQRFGVKLGLTNINKLLTHLGSPHKRLRCVHIAGSNGKGSTGAFLHSILTHSGYRAGFYTSPHLIDFTERIKIGKHYIKKKRVVELTNTIKQLCRKLDVPYITYFEFVTALAFSYFAEEGADPIVVEVGLGGRFDATNVIKPLVSIITAVQLEHQMYLGNTLKDIAREKAGIIKKGVPVISGVRNAAVQEYILQKAEQLQAPVYRIGRELSCRKRKPGIFNFKGLNCKLPDITCGLAGDHQMRNAAMAVSAALMLKQQGYTINNRDIMQGIKKTSWPGRMEVVGKNPTVILDGAHNPAAWRTLKKTLATYFHYKHLYLLIGIMDDKDIGQLFSVLIPDAKAVVLSRPQMQRAATREHIEKFYSLSARKNIFWIENVISAYKHILNLADGDDLVCVTGSFFIVGEVREYALQKGAGASGRIGM